MSDERDECDFQAEPEERVQQLMLGFFDIMAEAGMAGLNIVWLKFMNEFDARFPGLGRAARIGADYPRWRNWQPCASLHAPVRGSRSHSSI